MNAFAADAAQGWGLRAAEQGWPAGPAGEWITTSSWLPSGLGWILTFLLFPDGHLPSRRWRWVVRHILMKLDIAESEAGHRRVLAVLAHLRAAQAPHDH